MPSTRKQKKPTTRKVKTKPAPKCHRPGGLGAAGARAFEEAMRELHGWWR